MKFNNAKDVVSKVLTSAELIINEKLEFNDKNNVDQKRIATLSVANMLIELMKIREQK